MENIKIISLGGSIIVPAQKDTVTDSLVDINFLSGFSRIIYPYLSGDRQRKLILVCGGGTIARKYQQAFRSVCRETGLMATKPEQEDWIGIAATRLNAELLKYIFAEYCTDSVVYDPTAEFAFTGRMLLAAGWKPGFSTDYDAVILAERFNAGTVINLSNIAKVYTDDPAENPDARPVDHISWAGYSDIVGSEWVPGKNAPFDPVAAGLAAEKKIRVVMADGRNLVNLKKILDDENFEGTIIGPQ